MGPMPILWPGILNIFSKSLWTPKACMKYMVVSGGRNWRKCLQGILHRSIIDSFMICKVWSQQVLQINFLWLCKWVSYWYHLTFQLQYKDKRYNQLTSDTVNWFRWGPDAFYTFPMQHDHTTWRRWGLKLISYMTDKQLKQRVCLEIYTGEYLIRMWGSFHHGADTCSGYNHQPQVTQNSVYSIMCCMQPKYSHWNPNAVMPI